MNDLNKLNLKIKSLKYFKKVIIIETINKKLVYKDNNNFSTYDYLLSRNFFNFPNYTQDKNSKYDLIEYIDDISTPKEQKLKDLITTISFLHHKTSFSKEIILDDVKKEYEDIENEINYLMKYYTDINNYIDNILFMNPFDYLLVRNIDLFYYLLSFAKVEISNWYKTIQDKKIIRYSMIHNNVSINHIIENDKCYLISWDKAKIDIPIKDLEQIFKKYYIDLEFDNLIMEYQKYNKLSQEEYMLLLIKLAIPKKIEFNNNMFKNTYELSNYIEYLKKIAVIIHKIDDKKIKS